MRIMATNAWHQPPTETKKLLLLAVAREVEAGAPTAIYTASPEHCNVEDAGQRPPRAFYFGPKEKTCTCVTKNGCSSRWRLAQRHGVLDGRELLDPEGHPCGRCTPASIRQTPTVRSTKRIVAEFKNNLRPIEFRPEHACGDPNGLLAPNIRQQVADGNVLLNSVPR